MPIIQMQEYARRRQDLMKKMGSRAIALIPAARKKSVLEIVTIFIDRTAIFITLPVSLSLKPSLY